MRTLPLPEVTGEILGVDVVAGCDVPPFPRATMDGELLIPRGSLLRTRHVPTLAAEGLWNVPVYEHPSVAVLATGSELREPWEDAPAPCIHNTNAPFLMASLRSAGFAGARYLGIVADETGPLLEKIRAGLESDFLLITGGVSMGDGDLVPDCLVACGVRRILHKVSMKPGKPLFVGRSERGSMVVGFPGNPVAVMVHFSMFVQPLLLKATGARGVRVGAIKHDAHRFEIDHPGKDSHRLAAAGAAVTLISSPEKLALVRRHDAAPEIEEILRIYCTAGSAAPS